SIAVSLSEEVQPEEPRVDAGFRLRHREIRGQLRGPLEALGDFLPTAEVPEDFGADDLRDGGAVPLPGGEQRLPRDRAVPFVPDIRVRALVGERQEQPRTLRIVLRPELERSLSVPGSALERLQRSRPFPSPA